MRQEIDGLGDLLGERPQLAALTQEIVVGIDQEEPVRSRV